MTKTLVKHGNSLALIIEKPILDLLQIDADTPLKISTDGKALVMTPDRKSRSDKVRESADRMIEIHKETLKKLAQ